MRCGKKTDRDALVDACRFIAFTHGSCPRDVFGVEPFTDPCSEVCKPEQRLDECWGAFFLSHDYNPSE